MSRFRFSRRCGAALVLATIALFAVIVLAVTLLSFSFERRFSRGRLDDATAHYIMRSGLGAALLAVHCRSDIVELQGNAGDIRSVIMYRQNGKWLQLHHGPKQIAAISALELYQRHSIPLKRRVKWDYRVAIRPTDFGYVAVCYCFLQRGRAMKVLLQSDPRNPGCYRAEKFYSTFYDDDW